MDYTIGQLAALSGVTVRTLHHYEKRGLLPASGRTAAGYRHYTEHDVRRLHRILVCRQMGMPLKDIAPYLSPEAPPLKEILQQQSAALHAQMQQLRMALSIVDRLGTALDDATEEHISHQLLRLMKTMHTIQQHYTAGELDQLHALRDSLTPEARLQAQSELADLLEQFSSAVAAGTDPQDATVAALARRWIALGQQLASSTPLREKTRALIDRDPQIQQATGIDARLKAYIDQALASAR